MPTFYKEDNQGTYSLQKLPQGPWEEALLDLFDPIPDWRQILLTLTHYLPFPEAKLVVLKLVNPVLQLSIESAPIPSYLILMGWREVLDSTV